MTSVDTRERPDTHEMVVVHRLFRREAARQYARRIARIRAGIAASGDGRHAAVPR